MDIRAFCAKYLLYDVVLSHEYDTVKSWKDPWHYGRLPRTVNPIRLLMIQIAAYERLTRNSVFNSAFVNFFADRRLNKFMGWIFHLNPVFDPYAASSNARDSVWTREIDAPTVIPPNETLEESTTGARRATMFLLWAAMEYSMQEPGELRMKEYDKSYLRLRASYLGLPRDERGRILIGSSVTEDAGLADAALAPAVAIAAPVAAAGAASGLTRVFNLEEAALDNETQLHLSVAASKGMHVMVMAVKDIVPAETHPNTDQLIWVMDGSALLTLFFPQTTPTVLHLEPGDAYLIQRGVTHQIQNTTPKDEDRLLRLVTIYSPGKPE
jgi:mannose-6-phosphate isomerase-like protein (cupin superfamily)